MALAVSKAVVKVGAAGGAVYYSISKGVWSSSSEGAEVYEDLKTYVVPQVSEAVQKLPYEACLKWNECVKSSFSRLGSMSSTAVSDYVAGALKKAGMRSD
ncbi:hypothetical protein ECG_07463 [Echinococcus granulosus]|nr:hypothetical protein ECG_07110 [Echinococcus granulosus]KAH9280501.1 hypothetical protein ECG_07113 [Echinococcus granulosus]KAH9280758.1 hypothetical protein ECG_07463 [Echinococcus granulosus]